MKEQVIIYDTTLRDGQQGEDIEFSPKDMLEVAKKLDELGVHYIEGGWPGSNPRFDEFFRLAQSVDFKNARLVAFGKTREKNARAEDDKCLRALINANTPTVAIFGKSWKLHVEIMENSFEENLAMIADTVRYLKTQGKEVIYDAEHFFDGYKDDSEYALATLFAAMKAGADWITLCDTNGGTLPHEVQKIVKEVRQALRGKIKVGIHAHNDCGVAVANSIIAVQAGAQMVHGTINGFGERCGNANLSTLLSVFELKMGHECLPNGNLDKIKEVSNFVCELANMTPYKGRPFVGQSAFAHKGGIHVSAVMKNPRAYEHVTPEAVGNQRRILVSDLSGKSNIECKAREFGVNLGGNGFDGKAIATEIKKRESKGYKYEAAGESLRLLIERLTEQFTPLFEIESFNITITKEKGRRCRSVASVTVTNNEGKEETTAAKGFGPVGALDNALRKALSKFFPTDLSLLHLTDFKVRVIDGKEGTGAKVRALIQSRHGDRIFTTVGASNDVIEASFLALEDSFHAVISTNGNHSKKAE